MVLLSTMSCAQVENQQEKIKTTKTKEKKAPHKFGGWYCPDNLNGFPPVDITEWENVPVISGRLPTKEETQSEASLMYIDEKEYPDAKAIEIKLPQLASYYSHYSKKKEYVIIIQAVEIGSDSIVGFRYLNGGNGSSHLSEVNLLTSKEIESIPTSRFVSYSIKINATQDEIWKTLTSAEHLNDLKPTFKENILIPNDWKSKTSINYYYASPSDLTNSYADKLFGCFYVQNDYLINGNQYAEKFLLLENKEEHYTELKIVCGPYLIDYDKQQTILKSWAEKVKELHQ